MPKAHTEMKVFRYFSGGPVVCLLIILAACFSACNPKVSTSIQGRHTQPKQASEIEVLHIGSDAPVNVIKLGAVSVSEGAFTTNCSYEKVLFYARHIAARNGADLIHVTAHQPPNYWSKCHQIEADLYVLDREPLDTSLLENKIPEARSVQEFDGRSDSIVWRKPPIVDEKIVRISFGAGRSYRLSEIPQDLDPKLQSHLQGLTESNFINVELGFGVNRSFACGLRFDQMSSSNSSVIPDLADDSSEPPESSLRTDDLRITFIGPQVQWRALTRNKRLEFMWGASMGFMGYRNDAFWRKGNCWSQAIHLASEQISTSILE